MKKYSFRLEPVLKLKKLKEENCRMELGQLITQLSRIEDQLRHDRDAIGNYHRIQDGGLETGLTGRQLQAFPMLVSAKEQNIRLLEAERGKQEERIAAKKQELAVLRGDLKVMENLREKDFDAYKRALNKEIDQKVEEQTQNWLQFKDKKA
jgi:flagellar FliJ protein